MSDIAKQLEEIVDRAAKVMAEQVLEPALNDLTGYRQSLRDSLAELDCNSKEPRVAEDAAVMRTVLENKLAEVERVINGLQRESGMNPPEHAAGSR